MNWFLIFSWHHRTLPFWVHICHSFHIITILIHWYLIKQTNQPQWALGSGLGSGLWALNGLGWAGVNKYHYRYIWDLLIFTCSVFGLSDLLHGNSEKKVFLQQAELYECWCRRLRLCPQTRYRKETSTGVLSRTLTSAQLTKNFDQSPSSDTSDAEGDIYSSLFVH